MFKHGDKVKCIRINNSALVLGNEYTVIGYEHTYGLNNFIHIREHEDVGPYFADRFELIKESCLYFIIDDSDEKKLGMKPCMNIYSTRQLAISYGKSLFKDFYLYSANKEAHYHIEEVVTKNWIEKVIEK